MWCGLCDKSRVWCAIEWKREKERRGMGEEDLIRSLFNAHRTLRSMLTKRGYSLPEEASLSENFSKFKASFDEQEFDRLNLVGERTDGEGNLQTIHVCFIHCKEFSLSPSSLII